MRTIIDNCAVVAIHAITGETPEDIAAGIAAFPNEDGPAFVGVFAMTYSVGSYLESRGWAVLYMEDHPSIPWTCVVCIQHPGHSFAIVNGCIHDRCAGNYDGANIDVIFVPPKRQRKGRGQQS